MKNLHFLCHSYLHERIDFRQRPHTRTYVTTKSRPPNWLEQSQRPPVTLLVHDSTNRPNIVLQAFYSVGSDECVCVSLRVADDSSL